MRRVQVQRMQFRRIEEDEDEAAIRGHPVPFMIGMPRWQEAELAIADRQQMRRPEEAEFSATLSCIFDCLCCDAVPARGPPFHGLRREDFNECCGTDLAGR